MIIVLLGPPGSGKGTQAKFLAQRFNIPHIALGDMLREAVSQKTEVGAKAEKYLNAGKLVPDALVNEVTKERLSRENCGSGCILDGYPRTVGQAKALASILEELNLELDKVLYLRVSVASAVKRLSERRSCPRCGKVYHLTFHPPKTEGRCDSCGEKLYLRPDDKEEVVRTRFEVYEGETRPLIEFYKKQEKLVEIDGERKVKEVFENLIEALREIS